MASPKTPFVFNATAGAFTPARSNSTASIVPAIQDPAIVSMTIPTSEPAELVSNAQHHAAPVETGNDNAPVFALDPSAPEFIANAAFTALAPESTLRANAPQFGLTLLPYAPLPYAYVYRPCPQDTKPRGYVDVVERTCPIKTKHLLGDDLLAAMDMTTDDVTALVEATNAQFPPAPMALPKDGPKTDSILASAFNVEAPLHSLSLQSMPAFQSQSNLPGLHKLPWGLPSTKKPRLLLKTPNKTLARPRSRYHVFFNQQVNAGRMTPPSVKAY